MWTVQSWLSLSWAVLVLAGVAGKRSLVAGWAVAGFLASCVGDSFLAGYFGRGDECFAAGIVAFGIAHVCFFAYAWNHGRRLDWRIPGAAALGYGVYLVWLVPAIGNPLIAGLAVGYTVLSLLTLAAGCGMRTALPVRLIFSVGIGLLIFSDTLISLRNFLHCDGWHFLIIPTYELSHLAVAAAVLLDIGKENSRKIAAAGPADGRNTPGAAVND